MKGLEALEHITKQLEGNYYEDCGCLEDEDLEAINVIEKELKKAKAFDIIVKKSVNPFIIYSMGFTLEEYNNSRSLKKWKLTQEEYDLLKAVLRQ